MELNLHIKNIWKTTSLVIRNRYVLFKWPKVTTINVTVLFLSLFSFCMYSCGKEESRKLVIKTNPENGQDAIISRAHKNNNYGSLEILHLTSRLKQDSLLDDNRFLISFKLDSLQKRAKIDSAFVYLYKNQNLHEGLDPILVQRILEPWIEHRVTWNNQPPVLNTDHELIYISNDGNKEVKVEVTSLIQGFVKRKYRNLGFMFRLAEEDQKDKKISFFSSNSILVGKRPRLEIYYRYKNWFR